MDFRMYEITAFTKDGWPDYKCPSCGSHLQKGEVKSLECAETMRDKSHPEFSHEWVVEFFRADLTCTHPNCREPIFVTGTAEIMEFHDQDEGSWNSSFATIYKPEYFVPHLKFFDLPPNTPEKVRNCVNASFNLFFISSGSALNEIRNALEFLMDELKVPRFEKDEATGVVTRWDLDKRVGKMPNQDGMNLKMHVQAIKNLGNWGSHAVDTNRTDVLEAYKVLHYVLDEMYLKRGEVVRELAKRIKEDKRGG